MVFQTTPISSIILLASLFYSKSGMENASEVQVSMLIAMVFCTLFVTLQARSLHEQYPLVQKNINSLALLHKLGIDPSKHVQIRVDDSNVPLSPGDRLSPGGPDPQHNGKRPPSNHH